MIHATIPSARLRRLPSDALRYIHHVFSPTPLTVALYGRPVMHLTAYPKLHHGQGGPLLFKIEVAVQCADPKSGLASPMQQCPRQNSESDPVVAVHRRN